MALTEGRKKGVIANLLTEKIFSETSTFFLNEHGIVKARKKILFKFDKV